MGGTGSKVEAFFERVPIVGYLVSAGEEIAFAATGDVRHKAEAQRAAARCTNETVKAVFIGAAVALTPFEGGAAPAVWAAAGALGDLAGSSLQAAIEEGFSDDTKDVVGTEALDEWKKDPLATFIIHAGVGAAEGVIAGGVGTIVDGAYPAAAAELSQVSGVAAEGEAAQLTEVTTESWVESGVEEGAESARWASPRHTPQRAAVLVRQNAMRTTTNRQAFSFIVKKPSNFMKAWNAGRAKAKEIFTTRAGLRNYMLKKFGIAFAEAVFIAGPRTIISKNINQSVPAATTKDTDADLSAQSFHPVVMHVQGCISRTGLPAVLGHMHIATAETEPRDSRNAITSYAYVTHSPTQKAFIQFEDSKAGNGFHIRTSKDRYLSVASDNKKDRRGKNALFVHTAPLMLQHHSPATWAIEIYEEDNVVLKLIDSGDPSGSEMNGGYLVARFNKKSDGRKDGGAYLSVHKKPNGEHKVSMFGFRVMRQDKLWWMDVVGDYECHAYDNGGKNDYHYVTLSESMDHQGLYWMNRSKRVWTLTPQFGTRDTLLTHKDYPYSEDGPPECKVIFDTDQNVLGVLGPGNERYERLWWRDLDGMMFDGPNDGEHVSFTRAAERKYMILNRRFATGARVSQILRGDYKNRNALNGVGGESFVEILRDEFGGLVTGLKFSSEQETIFNHYSLVELLGRYVTQTEDEKRKRVVSTYMSIHGSPKGNGEVWWQGTNGETWSLKHVSRNKLAVGETCPYLKGGYTECSISRNAGGEVESLVGPGGRIFKRL